MNCRGVQQSLSAYIDQELPGSEMLRIRAHVTRCPLCMREEEALRALKHMLSNTPGVEPPSGFEQRLMTCIQAEQAVRVRSVAIGLPILICVSLAAAGLAFVALPLSQRSVAKAETIKQAKKSDVAWDIQLDQASFSGSDPLRGGRAILASDDERR